MQPIKSKIIYSHIMNVRIDDINFGNHLCHTKFANILHNARALFLKSHRLSESNCFNSGLVMLGLNIDYIGQCFFDDQLEISLGIVAIDKASVTFEYSVYNHTTKKVAANANTKMGFLDLEKGKLKRTPTEFTTLICNL